MSEDYDDIDDIENEDGNEDEVDRGNVVEEDELNDEIEDDNSDTDIDEDDVNEDEDDRDEDEDGVEDDEESEKSNIPISRLNEVIAQREAEKERSLWLEEQLEKLINQKSTPQPVVAEVKKEEYNFSEAEESYATLLIEGETTKAASLRNVIESERKKELVALIKQVEESSSEKATNSSKIEIESARFDSLITKFESEHTFLDADSDDYNDEAVDTVNTLLAGYVASGKTKSQALRLAVNKVSPMYEEKEEVKPSLGNKKKVAARKKAAKASNTQPPASVGKRGTNTDKSEVDISKLSEKAFRDLTVKERKILRGD